MTFVFKPTDKIDLEVVMVEKTLTANQEIALTLFSSGYSIEPWSQDSNYSAITVNDVTVQSVNTVMDIIRNPDK